MARLAVLAGSLVAIGACGSGRPRAPTAAAPGALPVPDIACRLEPERVSCTAINHHARQATGCLSAYLVVRRTATLIDGDRRACAPILAPGTTGRFDVLPGVVPGALCGERLAGCVLRVYVEREAGEVIDDVIALVREVERDAAEPGRDHPTLAECEALRVRWLARDDLGLPREVLRDPELAAMFCLRLPRADFTCLAAANDRAELDGCGDQSGS